MCGSGGGGVKSSRARSSTEWSTLRSRDFLEPGSSMWGSAYILPFLCPTLPLDSAFPNLAHSLLLQQRLHFFRFSRKKEERGNHLVLSHNSLQP